uniref:IS66 family transposase n=1 Tax=Cupriavidus taiwanensis TaxID=164546 RepID=UPI00358E9E88
MQQQEREIKLKDVKIEKITFELARLKAWKFGAKTEEMSAEQRRLFEETLGRRRGQSASAVAAGQGRALC